MKMNYRACNQRDFPQLMPLFHQLWPGRPLDEASMEEVFIRGLHDENQTYLCAELEGTIVGFCSLTIKNNLWQQGKLGHIDEIVVADTNRGQGIGTELLDRISQVAIKMECKRLELDSAHHRAAAHSFYERHGFENRALLFSKALESSQA